MTSFDEKLPEEQDPEFEELITLLRHAKLDPMVVDPVRRSGILSRTRVHLMKKTSLDGDTFAYDRQELGLVREYKGVAAGVLKSLWVNLEKALNPTGAFHKEAALGQQGFALLGDRYQLQDLLGQDALITTYLGWDTSMKRAVTIQILRDEYSADPKVVTRFEREAKAASSLQHPNIVQVYDYGLDDGNYYIIKEMVEGTDLPRYLRSHGMLDVDRAITVAHDVALALYAAHRRGMVHGDVKPQNMLIGRGGPIKLTDFGIASVYKEINNERLATTGMTLGTVQYFAPEQAQGEIVSSATDVYALGIVMYEMVTGHPPFDGDSPVAVAMQHIQDMPIPPSQVNPNISPALEEIILRCLEKAPERRFRDGSQLARALEALVDNEAGDYTATPVTPGHPRVPAMALGKQIPKRRRSIFLKRRTKNAPKTDSDQIPQRPSASRSNPSRDDQQHSVDQAPGSLANRNGAAIRIMVVDDHEVVRLGMRAAFETEPDLSVVGEASNGAEALAKLPVLDPQVILMDVRMEKMDGIEACREIKSQKPEVHILMITSYTDEDAMIASILAGASGYLLKHVSRTELLRGIRQVAAGQALIDTQAARQAVEQLVQAPGSELTEREREVLTLVARGYTNKQIAQELYVTEKTARNHVSHILGKLGLSRRSEAAAFAVEHKLVPPREQEKEEY